MRSAPIVFLTVDTEEDSWGAYEERTPSVRNVLRLRDFQTLCDRYGAKPTYFANYPVVNDLEAVAVLAEITEHGRGEIGTHIHAWNTPPFDRLDGPDHSMLSSLPEELVRRKLGTVHDRIGEQFGAAPTTFRSGRWGFGPPVARVLVELDYAVDSSVTPLLDWTADGGPDYRSAPLGPYRFNPDRVLDPDPGGPLLEIPATRGFLRGEAESQMRLRSRLSEGPAAFFRASGILDTLGFGTLRWLSPEVSTDREMRRLAENLVSRGMRTLNVTLHSPALEPGRTPFVRSHADLHQFLYRIEGFLDFAASRGYEFALVSQAPSLLGLSADTVAANDES